MELFDTHCHIDVDDFDADREQVLQRAHAAGVTQLLVPGIRFAQWPGLVAMCRKTPGLHLALGLHPVYLGEHRADHVAALATWVARERPLAIGEIGLDFFIKTLDRHAQLRLLEEQLAVAASARLPVVLHCRKAHDPMLRALRAAGVTSGICHAFNGSREQAEQYIALGFKLGFGGMLTYERSTKLRALAATLPLETIVLETDSPDMTVASHRYQRNSPEYIPEILSALAYLRGLPAELLAEQTTRNARTVLGLA